MFNKFWFDAKNINCFKNGFRVIKDLNLKISYSENVILIGPNGSGKSSLIEIINRNLYPVVANESKLKIFDKELVNLDLFYFLCHYLRYLFFFLVPINL